MELLGKLVRWIGARWDSFWNKEKNLLYRAFVAYFFSAYAYDYYSPKVNYDLGDALAFAFFMTIHFTVVYIIADVKARQKS